MDGLSRRCGSQILARSKTTTSSTRRPPGHDASFWSDSETSNPGISQRSRTVAEQSPIRTRGFFGSSPAVPGRWAGRTKNYFGSITSTCRRWLRVGSSSYWQPDESHRIENVRVGFSSTGSVLNACTERVDAPNARDVPPLHGPFRYSPATTDPDSDRSTEHDRTLRENAPADPSNLTTRQ